ncbi:MAG: DNA topoisomerase IV subunit A [Alphaproteobacteria bacterium]|nr:DNA topoisomerase IV subunit A [Alphaproteobacteria bacterium]
MGEQFTGEGGRIFEESFEEALSSRYLAYALSTITQRALPDARDGLKPVHRRLLYAMRLLKLDPESAFKKSARVVGDVIGRFHPHGDQAVYEALVRLAQDFASRYPLVEGQGNFGNVDGDGAAAMRYTEARLTEAARLVLQDYDAGTVDFRETYDGEDSEPIVLPSAFPNLLANGSAGIAVGMATNIPPHNAAELCDAARHLIKTPHARTETLLNYVEGPDFPTGGICVEPKETILEAYETGRGGFRLRARWEKEDLGRGQWRVIVTEIPYLVQKSKLIERMAALLDQKKLPLLADIMDESAEDIRLVLEPKSRTVDPALFMESLYKLTDLEVRIPLNLNILDPKGAPRVVGLKEALQIWLDHRRVVVTRRAEKRLEAVEDRLEVLAGYLVAYLNLDEVIRIIRFEDEVKAKLMSTFDLTERQAEAILNMRLRALRKLEEMEIKGEEERLQGERDELNALIGSEELQWKKVDGEIAEVKKTFAKDTALGARRTTFAEAPADDLADAVEEALIAREPVTVVLSRMGWIRALKGHQDDLSTLKHKDGDETAFAVKAETTDKLLMFASNGRVFTLDTSKLPGGRGFGEPVRLMVDLDEEAQPIALMKHDPRRRLLLAQTSGHGFIAEEKELPASKRAGRQVLNVQAGERMTFVIEAAGDKVAVLGKNKKLLVFALNEIPEMTRGKGVRLMGGKGGAVADIAIFDGAEGLVRIDPAGRRHEVETWRLYEAKRAQAGRMAPKGFSNLKFDAR